nr:putative uncharacterized protein DDB_G0282133 [Procambarus clarkii]
MKLKLSVVTTPPLTLKNGLAMKTGNYRPGSREEVSERSCEQCDKDQHLQWEPERDEEAVKGQPPTIYTPSKSALLPSHTHSAHGDNTECSHVLGCEDHCRSMSPRPGSASRGRSISTTSSDSTSTTCTVSSDFDGCNSSSSSSGTSSTNNTITSENSSSSTSRTNANNPFISTNNMSSSASDKSSSSSNSTRGDILPTLKTENQYQGKKKRRNCDGLMLSGVGAWGVSRSSAGPAAPHSKVTTGNTKFIINKKVKGIGLKNKILDGKTKNKNFSIKSSSLSLKANIIEGKTTSLNAKTASLSLKTNSLNTKTNSLSSNSSCDSKTSSSSTNSSKSLRSLFLRGNVFSSSFTFGKRNSKNSSNTASRALSSSNTLTNTNIVIIGDKGVGKSAIAVRFLTRRYIGEYSSDTEMMYQHETTVDHEVAHLHLLDAATAQTPHQILRHLAWADAFIVVYDVTSRTSFIHAKQLLRTLHTHSHALSYTHASSDREGNTGSVLDIHPQRSLDIHSKNGNDEYTFSSHDSYAVCSHDTLVKSVFDTHIPDYHGTHKKSTSNAQVSCRHNTNNRSGLNTHILNSHSINTLEGGVTHTRSDNDTSTWSTHGVYNHCAKSLYQNNPTYLKFNHPVSQSLNVSRMESSCRYSNTETSSVAMNPEASLATPNHYCQAQDYSHTADTCSQPLSHTSHRPNYHRRVTSHQFDSYGHHTNNNSLCAYRHHCQSNYNYTIKQNRIIDKRGHHAYTSRKLNTHDHYTNKHECVNTRNVHNSSQNSENAAELSSFHSSVFDIKHDQDTKSDRDTCGKNFQAHLPNTSCETKLGCENRSFAYINAPHSCQIDLNSSHDQQRNHSHPKSHKHKQSHQRYNIPIYSQSRGHCSSHNQPAYLNLDRSHPEDCNPGHVYLKSHRNGHSHLKNNSHDRSEPRIHSLNQNYLNCSPNNISNNYIAADHSHLRNYTSCHSHPNRHNGDEGHFNNHNLNHGHVRDTNPAHYHINKHSNSSHNNLRGQSLKHSHQEDHNPSHKHRQRHRSDHSQSREDKPDGSDPQEDSPEYSHPNLDDSPDSQARDHKHLKGHTTLLLGNKRDLEHFRCVWTDEGEALSLEFSCQFYEVSAADSLLGVHLAFHSLLKEARALQLIRRLPQPNPKVSKSVLSSAVSKVIGNFFTRAGSNSKQRQSNSI